MMITLGVLIYFALVIGTSVAFPPAWVLWLLFSVAALETCNAIELNITNRHDNR